MSPSASRACVSLLLIAAIATGVSTAASNTTATMQVSVTVVRSCSVSAPATSSTPNVDVTIDCQRGAVDAMSVGIAGAGKDTVQPVLPGINRVTVFSPQPSGGGQKPVVVTIDF